MVCGGGEGAGEIDEWSSKVDSSNIVCPTRNVQACPLSVRHRHTVDTRNVHVQLHLSMTVCLAGCVHVPA